MKSLIPVLKVNYTLCDIIKAFFTPFHGVKNLNKVHDLLSHYFDNDNIIMTASCRGAIYHILKSLPQKKVIIPAYTCEVVDDAIRLAGKEIVYAHVCERSLNICEYPQIDSDTIVLATHQYGFPAEMEYIVDVCRKVGAPLIEDCAGSFGTYYKNKLTGTWGDYAVFSFSASKTINSPTKGGFVLVKDKKNYNELINAVITDPDTYSFKFKQLVKAFVFVLFKNKSMASLLRRFVVSDNPNSSRNSNVDSCYTKGFYEWQAVVVRRQLENVSQIIREKHRLLELYDRNLTNPLIKKIEFPRDATIIRYPIFVEERDIFIQKALEAGVQCTKGYHRLICPTDYIKEKWILDHIVYLPCSSNYSIDDINRIIEIINKII